MQKSHPTLLFVFVTLFANLSCLDLLQIKWELPKYEEAKPLIEKDEPIFGNVRAVFEDLVVVPLPGSDDYTHILGFQRQYKPLSKKGISVDKIASMKFKFVYIMYTAKVDKNNNSEFVHSCDTDYDEQGIIDLVTPPKDEEWHSGFCEPNLYQICNFCWNYFEYKLGDCSQCYEEIEKEGEEEGFGKEKKFIQPDDDGCGVRELQNFVNLDIGIARTNSLSVEKKNITYVRSTNTMYYSIPVIGLPEAQKLLDFQKLDEAGELLDQEKPLDSIQLIELTYQEPNIPLSLVPKQKPGNELNLLI